MDKPVLFDSRSAPLYRVLGDVVALWTLAVVGYFVILPIFGLKLGYNVSPVPISIYYLFWALFSIWVFWDMFIEKLEAKRRVWLWLLLSLGFAALFSYLLSLLPSLPIAAFAHASTFAMLPQTPWYFLPKASEVLVQQVLIAALVLALHSRLRDLHEVMVAYALTFGSAHVILFLLDGAPTLYAAVFTAAAVLSTFVFPKLIIKVKGGFIYSYMIHLSFYILLAFLIRA